MRPLAKRQACIVRSRNRVEVGDANESFESDKRKACVQPWKFQPAIAQMDDGAWRLV